MMVNPGWWRLAANYWRTGCGEIYRSCSKAAFVAAVQRLLPEIQADDLSPAPAGVRAAGRFASRGLSRRFRVVGNKTRHQRDQRAFTGRDSSICDRTGDCRPSGDAF